PRFGRSSITGRRGLTPSPHPAERPLDALVPPGDPGLALRGAHPWLPPPSLDIEATQLIEPAPEADGQAGRIRGTERGRLGDGRNRDRPVQHVRLELHEQIVADHATVDPQ